MKTLYLIRHAKSSWSKPQLRDHERPLNNRGRSSLTVMSDRIINKRWHAEKLVSSTAVRAITTAKHLAPSFTGDVIIEAEPALYSFDQDSLLRFLIGQSNRLSSIVMVGHNPAMEDLFNYLAADQKLDKFPTCAVACFELDIDCWKDIYEGCGNLDEFEYPKKGL